MSATIKADGDTWRAELADDGSEKVVVFFCTTTDQRPYRVVQVEHGRFTAESFAEIDDETLASLFADSSSMGAPKEYPTYEN